MDNTEELKKQISELKVLSMRNYKALFDEHIARCVAAIVVDLADGLILHSTPPANQLFEYVNGEIDGKNIQDLMPERFRKQNGKHLLAYSDAPKHRSMGEGQMNLYGITKNNREFPIEISLYPSEIVGKRVVIATLMGIRQRKNHDENTKY